MSEIDKNDNDSKEKQPRYYLNPNSKMFRLLVKEFNEERERHLDTSRNEDR